MNAAALLRVSTEHQDLESQRHSIETCHQGISTISSSMLGELWLSALVPLGPHLIGGEGRTHEREAENGPTRLASRKLLPTVGRAA